MSHKKTKSLPQQVIERINEKFTPGRSRHAAKETGEARDQIFSYKTRTLYIERNILFAKWCKQNHHCKTVEQCREYVNEYLAEIIERCSPSTVSSYKSAIAKLYGCSSEEFIKTPVRHRADIKRSRNPVGMDRHFSRENNADLIRFVRCTGLRRSELSMLNGNEYSFQNGALFVHIRKGKGGKMRDAKVIGSPEDIEFIFRKLKAAGEGRVFAKIHSAFDQHAERAEYAARYYERIARPINEIPRKNRYVCRKDLKGLVLDKMAMLEISRSLGHNRVDVIASNYAYKFKEVIEMKANEQNKNTNT